jgi:aminomethyltransferase
LNEQALKTTPLFDRHVEANAAFTDFGGWNMPVRYTSDLAEHAAVRNAAGLFDISHMAEFFITGNDANAFLDHALVGVASEIGNLRAKYSLIVEASGGIIDDLIVYRLEQNRLLIIANAGNRAAVFAALTDRAKNFDVTLEDASDRFALLAIQGPRAVGILATITDAPLEELKYYSIFESKVLLHHAYLARTGYTGEDGFEILVANEHAVDIWDALLTAGESLGLIAAGYACRDTLRLEAGMPLYGSELSIDTNPYAAGLGRVVRLDHRFVGAEALGAAAATEPKRKLVGLSGEGKRAARAHYELFASETSEHSIGEITTGALSPTLGHPIAMAYLDSSATQLGTEIWADVRGSRQLMQVVPLPFYKRAK